MKPDSTMQKIIASVQGATLHEIRMSGKNRLYFTIRPAAGDEPVRIVILGAHGGDAATQRKFIDVVLGRN